VSAPVAHLALDALQRINAAPTRRSIWIRRWPPRRKPSRRDGGRPLFHLSLRRRLARKLQLRATQRPLPRTGRHSTLKLGKATGLVAEHGIPSSSPTLFADPASIRRRAPTPRRPRAALGADHLLHRPPVARVISVQSHEPHYFSEDEVAFSKSSRQLAMKHRERQDPRATMRSCGARFTSSAPCTAFRRWSPPRSCSTTYCA